jgi:hypothetical protein
MEENQNMTMPQQPQEPALAQAAAQPAEKTSKLGPVIGIIIVVSLLILGGLYYWGSQLSTQEPSAEDILSQEDSLQVDLAAQGTSDELDAIEQDLLRTDLDTLDEDMAQLESSM